VQLIDSLDQTVSFLAIKRDVLWINGYILLCHWGRGQSKRE